MSVCPVGACSSPVRHGQLMCLFHWRTTPATLQMAVTRSWRAFVRRADRSDGIALLMSYRAARDAALACHDPREAARG